MKEVEASVVHKEYWLILRRRQIYCDDISRRCCMCSVVLAFSTSNGATSTDRFCFIAFHSTSFASAATGSNLGRTFSGSLRRKVQSKGHDNDTATRKMLVIKELLESVHPRHPVAGGMRTENDWKRLDFDAWIIKVNPGSLCCGCADCLTFACGAGTGAFA